MKIKEITEKDQWEEFIHRNGRLNISFFLSWEWGEFEKKLGKTIFRLGFYDSNELVSVAQMIDINAKRGNYLHLRNGPVLDWDDKKLANQVLTGIVNFAKQKHKSYIRISPLIPVSDEILQFFEDQGFTDSQMHDVDAEITWVIDLDQSEEDILKNMRKNTRYSINKAKRDGVEIEISSDPSDLKKFWPIYEDTVKRKNWNAYDYNYLKKEFEVFSKNYQAKIFLAKYKGQYISAAIFIYYGSEVYYHHSGSISEFRNIPAAYLIQWESIKHAKEKGFKTYNFFGIARDNDKNHPWHGLTFFKKGFGGYERRSIHAKDYPIKLRYWLVHYFEKFERVRKGYSRF